LGLGAGLIGGILERDPRAMKRSTPGTSALFALTTDPSMREVADAFRGTEAELLATSLTPEQEERLLGAFGLTGATA
jgi:uncharacterized membrane protein